MSTIPKAKRSTFKHLTVNPDDWDHYPTVEHSTVTSCHFENLSAATKLDRCTLKDVTLQSREGSVNRGNLIDRSDLMDCEIIDSRVDRSELRTSTIYDAHVERSPMKNVRLVGPRLKVERSQLENCEILGKSVLERSVIKDSLLEEVRLERSIATRSYVTNSTFDRSTVEDCDVNDCKLEGTHFVGMILRNGCWKGGDLVKRLDPKLEVTVIKKSDIQAGRTVMANSVRHVCQLAELSNNLHQEQQEPAQGYTGVPHRGFPQPPTYDSSTSRNVPPEDRKEPYPEPANESRFVPESYDGPRLPTAAAVRRDEKRRNG